MNQLYISSLKCVLRAPLNIFCNTVLYCTSPCTENIYICYSFTSTCLGIETNIKKRITIYQDRINTYLLAQKRAQDSRLRNEKRSDLRKNEIRYFTQLSSETLQKQCWQACAIKNVDILMSLIEKGCNPNEQTPRGMTPLLAMVLAGATIEQFDKLFKIQSSSISSGGGVDVNFINK